MAKETKLTVFFIGGTEKVFFGANVRTLASNFRANEWVEIENCEINSKNVAYYTITDF